MKAPSAVTSAPFVSRQTLGRVHPRVGGMRVRDSCRIEPWTLMGQTTLTVSPWIHREAQFGGRRFHGEVGRRLTSSGHSGRTRWIEGAPRCGHPRVPA